MAAKSVDSLIGKIRAIFRDEGRAGDWNPMLFTGNPAASPLMKRHLQSVTLEQQNANTIIRQAVPMMFDKLGRLCRYLSYQISREQDSVTKFLFARDLSYFSFICHSGNRGGDLGQLTSSMIFELPQNKGIFISQSSGKTAAIDNPNNFSLIRSKDVDICPILHLEKYVKIARTLKIDLSQGYLFRIRDSKSREIINRAVSSSAMTDRLRLHLKAINLYEGETSHSSRRGCAITLRMLGVADNTIYNHLGWHQQGMIRHYATMGELCSPKGAAATLSEAAVNLGSGKSKFNQVSDNVSALKQMKSFIK